MRPDANAMEAERANPAAGAAVNGDYLNAMPVQELGIGLSNALLQNPLLRRMGSDAVGAAA